MTTHSDLNHKNNSLQTYFCLSEIQTPGDIEITAGQDKELYCLVAEPYQGDIVAWQQDGENILMNSGQDMDNDGRDDIIIYNNNTLQIIDGSDKDIGVYTCAVAVNIDNQLYNITANIRVTYKPTLIRPDNRHHGTAAIPVAASASAISLVVVLLAIVAWYFLVRKQLLHDVNVKRNRHQHRHSSHRHSNRRSHQGSVHGSSVHGDDSGQGSMKSPCSIETNDNIGQGSCDIELANENSNGLPASPCTVYTSAKVHPSLEIASDEDSPNPSRHSSVSRKSYPAGACGGASPPIERHDFSPHSSPIQPRHYYVDCIEGSPRTNRYSMKNAPNDINFSNMSPRTKRPRRTHSVKTRPSSFIEAKPHRHSMKGYPKEAFSDESPRIRRKRSSRRNRRTPSNASERRSRPTSLVEQCSCQEYCQECYIQQKLHYHHHHRHKEEYVNPPVPPELQPLATADINVETV
ncbi:uncharacterized protein LOC144360111 [Saccoglossus kowalevskii]